MVLIPAITAAVVLGSLSVYKRGAELADDPEFQRKVKAGEVAPLQTDRPAYKPTKQARFPLLIFLASFSLSFCSVHSAILLPHYTVTGRQLRCLLPTQLKSSASLQAH